MSDELDLLTPVLESQEVLLHSTDPQERLVALAKLQALLRTDAEKVASFMLENQMPVMDSILKIISAEALLYTELSVVMEMVCNIASTTGGLTKTLVYDYNIIAAMAKLLSRLKSEEAEQKTDLHYNVTESCIWAFVNIAGDSKAMRNAVVQAQVVDMILEILEQGAPLHVARVSMWAFSSFCKDGQLPNYIYKIVPALMAAIRSEDEPLLTDALSAMSRLTNGSYEGQESLWKDPYFFESVGVFLGPHSRANRKEVVLNMALRTIGNMIAGPDQYTIEMIQKGLVELLVPLLDCEDPWIMKETCWCFANILNISPAQTEICMLYDFVPRLIQLNLIDDTNVQLEAAWALVNALHTAPSYQHQLRIVQTPQFIEAYCACLLHNDRELASKAFKSIMAVLELSSLFCGSSRESFFVEYLRIRCYETVRLMYLRGGEEANDVRPLWELFQAPDLDLSYANLNLLDQ